jgi:membrane protein
MPRMAKTSALARPWQVATRTIHTFGEIDGEQRAAAFAYYAIFSLIPLVALLFSVGSMFFEPGAVKHAIAEFIPRDSPGQEMLWQMVDALQRARGGVSVVSIVILAWSSLKFFQALVRAVNRAWHTEEFSWWQLPLKNLAMIGIITSGFGLGIVLPALVQGVTKGLVTFEHFIVTYFPRFQLAPVFHALELGRYLVGGVVLLYTITLLYTFAPRRRVPWRYVWLPALSVAVALQLLQVALVNYLTRFVNYNAVYGPIGGLMLLLFWIYLSGIVIIFGACFSVALAEPDTD